MDAKEFKPLPPVACVDAPGLTDAERSKLLVAINSVRTGVFVVEVAVVYDKQTDAKPRLEGTHYLGIPGVSSKLHLGTLVKAPTNKAGEVYLLVSDAARGTGEKAAQWTALKLKGLKSFQVRGVTPGPLAQAALAACAAPVEAAPVAVEAGDDRGECPF